MSKPRAPWLLAAAGTLAIFAWQWATVTANYGGNWRALYCTGGLQRLPPLIAAEHVYIFPNSTGYDGQFYHYMAHDPLIRTDLQSYIDDGRLRYRRIFVPLLAYALALGQAEWIDPAYELVFLLNVWLGVYWSCRLLEKAQLPPYWGLLFLFAPSVLVSADRLVVDCALAALTAGFLYYHASPGRVYPILACAALTRETGIILLAGYFGWLAWKRQFRASLLVLTAGVPALGWFLYVNREIPKATLSLPLAPFLGVWKALTERWPYPPGTPYLGAVVAADYLALLGLLLAFAFAFVWFVRKPSDPGHLVAVLFAAAGLLIQGSVVLQVAFDFGRVYTPLLLCLEATAARRRKPWLLAPAAMILPRIAIQFAPQVLGMVRRGF